MKHILSPLVLAAALAMPAHAQEAGGTLNLVIQPEPPSLMMGLVQTGQAGFKDGFGNDPTANFRQGSTLVR